MFVEVISMKRKFEAVLLKWKIKNVNRKPLLLYGARQTGKTFLLQQFGKEHYDNTIYINFENQPGFAEVFQQELSPEHIISNLELMLHERILPEKTLLIFDEIQAAERVLTSLKYFYENAPDYHVVAAGSLLGVAMNRQAFSFPVGKVELHTLYPLDFEEFLWATGNEQLANKVRLHAETLELMPEALHQMLLDLYRKYLLVGGMPEAVQEFISTDSMSQGLNNVAIIQNDIINSYVADMAKYATPTETIRIQACYNSLPSQLAKDNKKFQYRIVQHGGRANVYASAIEWLAASGVVLPCYKINTAQIPLTAYADMSSFKLYFSDVGLMIQKSNIPQEIILNGYANIFMGAITENYVAQALTANALPLYYWTSNQTAEIDFLMQESINVVPIEVKKGTKVRSRSLDVYRQNYTPVKAIRFSEKNFGSENELISLPLYAVFTLSNSQFA